MYFCHSSKIWQEYPQLAAGLLVVGEVHPQVEVEARLQYWYERGRERLGRSSEGQMPEVSAWRRAYAQMGLRAYVEDGGEKIAACSPEAKRQSVGLREQRTLKRPKTAGFLSILARQGFALLARRLQPRAYPQLLHTPWG